MKNYNMFQVLGAAITTIGAMFIIIICLSCLGVLPSANVTVETAIISAMLMVNGYIVLLCGVMSSTPARIPGNVSAVTSTAVDIAGKAIAGKAIAGKPAPAKSLVK